MINFHIVFIAPFPFPFTNFESLVVLPGKRWSIRLKSSGSGLIFGQNSIFKLPVLSTVNPFGNSCHIRRSVTVAVFCVLSGANPAICFFAFINNSFAGISFKDFTKWSELVAFGIGRYFRRILPYGKMAERGGGCFVDRHPRDMCWFTVNGNSSPDGRKKGNCWILVYIKCMEYFLYVPDFWKMWLEYQLEMFVCRQCFLWYPLISNVRLSLPMSFYPDFRIFIVERTVYATVITGEITKFNIWWDGGYLMPASCHLHFWHWLCQWYWRVFCWCLQLIFRY